MFFAFNCLSSAAAEVLPALPNAPGAVLLVAPLATAHASLALGPKDPGVFAGNQLSLALRLEASSFGDVDGVLLGHECCDAFAQAAANRTKCLALFGPKGP